MKPAIKLTDADKSLDFSQAIQGHVGQNIAQRFTVDRQRTLKNDRLRMEIVENIVYDQFGNLYVVFTTKLLDGEVYAVTDWVAIDKPGFPRRLVKEFKSFGHFNDSMLQYLQEKAFIAFGREVLAILKGRQAASLPMATALPSGHELPALLN